MPRKMTRPAADHHQPGHQDLLPGHQRPGRAGQAGLPVGAPARPAGWPGDGGRPRPTAAPWKAGSGPSRTAGASWCLTASPPSTIWPTTPATRPQEARVRSRRRGTRIREPRTARATPTHTMPVTIRLPNSTIGVVLPGRHHPVAGAGGPVRAAQARPGEPHRPAGDDDESEGPHRQQGDPPVGRRRQLPGQPAGAGRAAGGAHDPRCYGGPEAAPHRAGMSCPLCSPGTSSPYCRARCPSPAAATHGPPQR